MIIVNQPDKLKGPQIDWNEPIVEFRPWPFHTAEVHVPASWYLAPGGVWEYAREGWGLAETEDCIMGTLTDGKPFITSRRGMENLK